MAIVYIVMRYNLEHNLMKEEKITCLDLIV